MTPWNFPNRPGSTVIELLAVVLLFAVLLTMLSLGKGVQVPAADEGGVVVGYEYISDAKMKTIRVAKPLPKGQNKFDLVVENQTFKLEAGKPFWFNNQFPAGVDRFVIKGINTAEELDPKNNLAFPVGISWMEGNQQHKLTINPITKKPSVLARWLLIGAISGLALGAVGLVAWWWRKSHAD
jgi:hypothetical protein